MTPPMTGEIIATIIVIAGLFGVPLLMITGIIRSSLRKRHDAEENKQKIHDAMKKIMADGKVEGPKGKFVWKRWGRKWLEYSNALPAPKGGKRIPRPEEFPRYPHAVE